MNRTTSDPNAVTVGVDLGGTNLRVAVFRGLSHAAHSAKDPDARATAATPVLQRKELVGDERDPNTIADRLAASVRDALSEADVSPEHQAEVPVGIGFAGMLRGRAGMVANAPNFEWRDVDFGSLVRNHLGADRPLVIANDVSAITYGECTLGAAPGARDALAVFAGTGVGGGVISNGELVEGGTGCAGEIGHAKVIWDSSARPCACGLHGCVEAYIGGRNLQTRARLELAGGARSKARELAGSADSVNPGHLDAAAAQGDDYALGLYTEIAPLLGVVIANAVSVLNPSHLVLGGGMLSRTPVLKEHVIAALWVAVNPPAGEQLQIVDAALGDCGGLVGSALLAG